MRIFSFTVFWITISFFAVLASVNVVASEFSTPSFERNAFDQMALNQTRLNSPLHEKNAPKHANLAPASHAEQGMDCCNEQSFYLSACAEACSITYFIPFSFPPSHAQNVKLALISSSLPHSVIERKQALFRPPID